MCEPLLQIKARAAALTLYSIACFFFLAYLRRNIKWRSFKVRGARRNPIKTALVVVCHAAAFLCRRVAQATEWPLQSWLGFPIDGTLHRVFTAFGLTFCLFFGTVVAETLEYVVAKSAHARSSQLMARFQLIHHWTIGFRNLVVVRGRWGYVERACSVIA